MKRLIVGVVTGLAVVVGAVSPAVAEQPPPKDIGALARDDGACAEQAQASPQRLPATSPSCGPAGTGITENHNETLVRDAD